MYLYGIEFELYTNHKPLERFKPIKTVCTNRKVNFAISAICVYTQILPGEQNTADPLSRLLRVDEHAEPLLSHKVAGEFVRFIAVSATFQGMTTREIEEASSEDRQFVELHREWKLER